MTAQPIDDNQMRFQALRIADGATTVLADGGTAGPYPTGTVLRISVVNAGYIMQSTTSTSTASTSDAYFPANTIDYIATAGVDYVAMSGGTATVTPMG